MRAYILGLLLIVSTVAVLADSSDKFHCSVVGIGMCDTDREFALSDSLGYYNSYRFQCYTLDLRFNPLEGVRANRIDFGGRFAIPTQEILPSESLCIRRRLGLDYEKEGDIARVYITSDCPNWWWRWRLDNKRKLVAIWDWEKVPFSSIRVGFGSGDINTYKHEFTLQTVDDNRITRNTPDLKQRPSSNMRGGKGYSTRTRAVRIQYPEMENPNPHGRNYPFFEDYITLDAVLDMVGTHFGSGIRGPDDLVPFSLYNIRAPGEYIGLDIGDIRQVAKADMSRDDIEAAFRAYLEGYVMGGFIGATGDLPDGASCTASGDCQSGICEIGSDNPTCQPRFHDCQQDPVCFADNIGRASYRGEVEVIKPAGTFLETFSIDYLLSGGFSIIMMNIETPLDVPDSFNPEAINSNCVQYYVHLDEQLDDIAEGGTIPQLLCENIDIDSAKELVHAIHNGGGINGGLLVECNGGLKNMVTGWSDALVNQCSASDLEYLLGSHKNKGISYQPLSTLLLNLALEKATS